MNAGADFDLTPKLKSFAERELSAIRAHRAASSCCCFESPIHNTIGLDYSLGFQYRPPLSENISITGGASALLAGTGISRYLLRQDTVLAFRECAVSVLSGQCRCLDDGLSHEGCNESLDDKSHALRAGCACLALGALAVSLLLAALAARMPAPSLRAADEKAGPNLMGQTQDEADRKSAGCISCHTQTDEPTMHATGTVRLGCTDCHGGNADARVAAGRRRRFAGIRTSETAGAPAAARSRSWRIARRIPSARTRNG